MRFRFSLDHVTCDNRCLLKIWKLGNVVNVYVYAKSATGHPLSTAYSLLRKDCVRIVNHLDKVLAARLFTSFMFM